MAPRGGPAAIRLPASSPQDRGRQPSGRRGASEPGRRPPPPRGGSRLSARGAPVAARAPGADLSGSSSRSRGGSEGGSVRPLARPPAAATPPLPGLLPRLCPRPDLGRLLCTPASAWPGLITGQRHLRRARHRHRASRDPRGPAPRLRPNSALGLPANAGLCPFRCPSESTECWQRPWPLPSESRPLAARAPNPLGSQPRQYVAQSSRRPRNAWATA